MSKSEREGVISQLSSMLFSAMLDDIVLDVTLQAHHEVQKANSVCYVCHTRCGSAHASSSSNTLTTAVGSPPSRPGTPDTKPMNLVSGTPTGGNTPINGKADGTIYFECLSCKRQIASNRYAPHLSGCMGIGAGNRRGASRNTMVKPKLSSEPGRSTSPYLGSDAGNVSDESKSQNIKGKGKSRYTRKDDAEFNLHRKRPGSPQISPKKLKKTKNSGSPLKNSTEAAMPPPPSSRKTNKSRAESTTSDFVQDREGSVSASVDNESRVSVFSPEATPMTPTSSTDSRSNSITLTNGTGKSGSVKPKTGIANGAAMSVTPSRPPPPVHKMPDPNFMMDYEGEETGSSTDSDSD